MYRLTWACCSIGAGRYWQVNSGSVPSVRAPTSGLPDSFHPGEEKLPQSQLLFHKLSFSGNHKNRSHSNSLTVTNVLGGGSCSTAPSTYTLVRV
ncbi:predicted protein [Botrytis cinerea T4]|uniref:Uncharacterized protein n=1 Tax=Botryotinia fuckeliana (strain T4) TaxID=999810 RepID=G2YK05_BOTF4|nr:predicted protein [Botrytis cinerea T4]